MGTPLDLHAVESILQQSDDGVVVLPLPQLLGVVMDNLRRNRRVAKINIVVAVLDTASYAQFLNMQRSARQVRREQGEGGYVRGEDI